MRRTFQVILLSIESRTLCGSPKTVERCNRMEGRKDYREASERARVHARASCSGPAGRPLFVASSATPPSSERASERPAAYKIQIVCPPLRCVPRSFSSVGLGRGRSFRRLSFKQKNHLFRWWVPFVFWNFLAGPTGPADGHGRGRGHQIRTRLPGGDGGKGIGSGRTSSGPQTPRSFSLQ